MVISRVLETRYGLLQISALEVFDLEQAKRCFIHHRQLLAQL